MNDKQDVVLLTAIRTMHYVPFIYLRLQRYILVKVHQFAIYDFGFTIREVALTIVNRKSEIVN
jgi:hypothetical protein